MKETKSKSIQFCPGCRWNEDNEELNNWDKKDKCPKCNAWCFEIYENKIYEEEKILYREAGITDNDETYYSGRTLKELQRILNKGMKLMEKE